MRLVRTEVLFDHSNWQEEAWFRTVVAEVTAGIQAIVWPPGNDKFAIFPEKQGNGVSPIKDAFVLKLKSYGWQPEAKLAFAVGQKPGPVDAVKHIPTADRLFAVEWETGNVSSSHRALNKMCLGVMKGFLLGGILVVPSRKLYPYLTDRIGNFQEIEPYFPVWRSVDTRKSGFLAVMEVEHDEISPSVPRIEKGTDGRALV